MPGTVKFDNPNFPSNPNGKRGSVELGKRQSTSSGTSGLLKTGGVVKLDDISDAGVKAGKPARNYSLAIANAQRTVMHLEQENHAATRNMLKMFLGIVLAAGLLATFGVVFYVSTSDGSKVQGTTWRTQNDDPVAVSAAVTRVSMDDEFGALVEESRRRRLTEGDESSLTDSAECASLKSTTEKMKRVFVSGTDGESFSCKVGSTMINCEGVTATFNCETGEKIAYAPNGERRLGKVAHPEGETEHSLMNNEEHHVHGRSLWFWKFLAAIFGIEEVEAEVEEEFESRPAKKIDCVVTSWTSYDTCTYNNGNWRFDSDQCVQGRTRTISTNPAHGGRSCPALSQYRACSCPSVVDGKITSGEECDDGNSANGDGCSSSQKVESGFSCTPNPPSSSSYFVDSSSSCHGQWNNGVVDFGEECDDGNVVSGDGCHNGVRDPSYLCKTAGQPCVKARVRRDWNQLTDAEKTLYVSAINDLKKSGIYDDFVHVHGLTNNKEYAHGTGGFLPWHRWYLFQFEEALRNQDPKYKDLTIPYWDWGEEADLCAAQGGCRYLDEKSDIIAAFGGAGTAGTSLNGADAFQVDFAEGQTTATVGPFGSSAQDPNTADSDPNIGCVGAGQYGFTGSWIVPELPTHDDLTCLSRSKSLESAGTEGFTSASDMIETIMMYDSYIDFRPRLEGLPHANPHNLLGGHIRTFVSPADPLFFSHHTYVDKLWAQWQDCHDHENKPKESISAYGDDYYMHVFDKSADNVMDEAQAKSLGLWDHVDGALPFFAIDPNSATSSAACMDHPNKAPSAPTDHSCAQCVAYYDDWCNGAWTEANPGSWDGTCEAICSNQCTAYCGTPPAVIHASKFKRLQTAGLFPDALEGAHGSAITPRNMHDIADENYLGYSYEPDEFDKKLIDQDSWKTCNMGHYMWHYDGLSKEARRLRFDEMTSRRKLSSDDSATLDKVYEKFSEIFESAKNGSDYIDDKNVELDGITAVREKECKLLYKKYPITGEMTPDEIFWRKWGKRSEFVKGILDGKCEKYLSQ
mmetsp:Transcript_11164/g.22863  ORF Transcript_11164/g.22863 Transcript_11164/m.22863 type:complete len:1028 (+) Transcript_11164:56-3139(+)